MSDPRRAATVVRGVSQLACDGVERATRIVEAMHANIAAVPAPLGRGSDGRARGLSGFVYKSIRFVNGGVRVALDGALGWVSELPASPNEPARSEPWQSILNGVLGDHLAASENPLAIPMQLRIEGGRRERILLLVHGLCMSARQWARNGHDHGEALARELAATAVYAHYNSGRHVSENGRELADQIEALSAAWPARESELVIVAHSLGGLVARSACHFAAEANHRWLRRLTRIAFLGTPHHGAPLERGGHWVDQILGVSPYSAPLARLGMLRSAGITDLRHGSVREEDWRGRDRFASRGDSRVPTPLPEGVACYALAGGADRLVPIASALGQSKEASRTLDFPEAHCWVGDGISHFDLLDSAAVYARLRETLSPG